MPAGPRADVVAKGEVGVYHCWNRCVQRALLCGADPLTGRDYEYRREWIQQTEQLLASLFAVEVAFHAELSNHIHVIVRTRPDVAGSWSDEDVVKRWLSITKLKRHGADSLVEPTPEEMHCEQQKPNRLTELRQRLADVSWFMGTLCEAISRRCNRDAGTSGAFWEHRFDCRSLVDEAAILVCGIYVDLNAIRAQEADTPEESRHTSAYDRIQGFQQQQQLGAHADEISNPNSPRPDRWLCELTLQDSDEGLPRVVASKSPWRASDKGILPLCLEKYLELLDWTGRQVRSDKRGAIPDSLAPILDRLQIAREQWLDAILYFDQWFGRIVGSCSAVSTAAERAGHVFRGARQCAQVFG